MFQQQFLRRWPLTALHAVLWCVECAEAGRRMRLEGGITRRRFQPCAPLRQDVERFAQIFVTVRGRRDQDLPNRLTLPR